VRAGDLVAVHEWPQIWRRGRVVGVETEALFEGGGADRVQVGLVSKLKVSDRFGRLKAIGRHCTPLDAMGQSALSVKAFASMGYRALLTV